MTLEEVDDFSVSTIERYLSAGGDIDQARGPRGWSLLHHAAEHGEQRGN